MALLLNIGDTVQRSYSYTKPSPSHISTPEECGNATGQLIPYPFYSSDGEYAGVQFTTDNGRIVANGTLTSGLLYYLWRPAKFPAGEYTISVKGKHSGATIYFRDTTNNVSVAYIYGAQGGDRSITFTVAEEISAMVYINAGSGTIDFDCTIMLNAGDESLPFAPNAYAIPISCGGATQTVYLPEPLRKIGGYADSVSSDGTVTRRIKKLVMTGQETLWGNGTSTVYLATAVGANTMMQFESVVSSHYIYHDGGMSSAPNNSVYTKSGEGTAIWFKTEYGNDLDAFKAYLAAQYANGTPVCVWYILATPQTETVTVPALTPAKGANTLTVDTDLQPSEVSITGHIKAS